MKNSETAIKNDFEKNFEKKLDEGFKKLRKDYEIRSKNNKFKSNDVVLIKESGCEESIGIINCDHYFIKDFYEVQVNECFSIYYYGKQLEKIGRF
jgi:hypothetical protein